MAMTEVQRGFLKGAVVFFNRSRPVMTFCVASMLIPVAGFGA
jgi:hypothetical protein